ncbi:hypothetical protein HELRODRAFT_126342, partial [Helobdella robusta]|uniref:S1 motif domain-containing protein n=1 Tax=Helobdella robusta TaxID=6412 RepID=T1EH95_HELRO
SFARLLKNSPFIQIGDPNGAVVRGTIIETLDDNLYIDFGGKFHCVCKKPRYKTDMYTRGTKVRLRLIDLELASKFMGSDKGISLLEADAVLLGIDRD